MPTVYMNHSVEVQFDCDLDLSDGSILVDVDNVEKDHLIDFDIREELANAKHGLKEGRYSAQYYNKKDWMRKLAAELVEFADCVDEIMEKKREKPKPDLVLKTQTTWGEDIKTKFYKDGEECSMHEYQQAMHLYPYSSTDSKQEKDVYSLIETCLWKEDPNP